MPRVRGVALLAGGAVLGAAVWWRTHPSACPHSVLAWGGRDSRHARAGALREILEPRAPGERAARGRAPGHAGTTQLPVAEWLAAAAPSDVLEQQEMLDHTLRRAREGGIENISATRADARELPYGDDSFDGAYLVTVLGEIPDQDAALRELRRVVRPGGRIVVGELFGDPHMVTHSALAQRAAEAGLRMERKLGGALWHFTRLQA